MVGSRSKGSANLPEEAAQGTSVGAALHPGPRAPRPLGMLRRSLSLRKIPDSLRPVLASGRARLTEEEPWEPYNMENQAAFLRPGQPGQSRPPHWNLMPPPRLLPPTPCPNARGWAASCGQRGCRSQAAACSSAGPLSRSIGTLVPLDRLLREKPYLPKTGCPAIGSRWGQATICCAGMSRSDAAEHLLPKSINNSIPPQAEIGVSAPLSPLLYPFPSIIHPLSVSPSLLLSLPCFP